MKQRTYNLDVSIRASAREATSHSSGSVSRPRCFNPRLRAGGDSSSVPSFTTTCCFNPRLRAGGDIVRDEPIDHVFVSIRASAREATTRTAARFASLPFQSAPPRGRRHDHHAPAHRERGFNPRLRAGGDPPSRTACWTA